MPTSKKYGVPLSLGDQWMSVIDKKVFDSTGLGPPFEDIREKSLKIAPRWGTVRRPLVNRMLTSFIL